MKNQRSGWCGLFALAAISGTVYGVGVSGAVNYSDGGGTARPARRIRVEIYAANPGGDVLVGTTNAANDGTWSADVAGPAGTVGFFTRYVAQNDGASVRATAAGAPYFVSGPGFPVGGGASPAGTIDTTGGNEARAFAVADAMQTSWLYAGMVRPAAPARLPAVFPEVGAGNADFYTGGVVHIRQWRRYAWDVINHEYGHYLNDIDGMDNNPGGYHEFGTNNIGMPTPNHPLRTKSQGVRLAWGEGLATYTGTASQAIAPRPGSPTVGDTIYTSLDSDTAANTFEVGLDTNGDPDPAGEGDETAVMRILWDLADGTGGSEPHDRVTFGHTAMYAMINNDIAGVDELDDLWDHLFTRPTTTDALRVDYGAIFEEYGVSPHPVGAAIGAMFDSAGPAPTFEWERQNDNRNDSFQLLIFNEMLTTRVLDITIAGDVDEFTLTGAMWDILRAMNGNYKFVVAGSDTTTYTTGAYWSDAYGFQVVPTPGTLALLGLTGLLAARRRR